ncbi:MAG: type I-C CRISPR-associated protein Cas8c/Csd1 [Geminicoccaceae bacterium]|nr:type I-C CRISPR-associated protein Cas8c/Csd1 [Geminicoccaceae bacterium]
MILQRLVELYARRTDSDVEDPLPEPGWTDQSIDFVVELAASGAVRAVLDLREASEKGGNKRAPKRRVPAPPKRTTNEAACLLWDKPEYALGIPDPKFEKELRAKGKATDDAAARRLAAERAQRRHALFRQRVEELAIRVADPGLAALRRFLSDDPARAVREVASPETADALEEQAGNVSFRLEGDTELLCRRPAIRRVLTDLAETPEGLETAGEGQCSVTGKFGPIARLHPPIKGVVGSQTSGANIVSFNKEAFESFGLSQGANAPVGLEAAFAYTTALNALLARDSGQNLSVGGTSVVFWAGRTSPNERVLCPFLAAMAVDDPGRGSERVRALYEAPRKGVPPCVEDDTPFYILALSAESRSRITVRFFHQGTIRAVAETVLRWLRELEIVGPEREGLALRELLKALSVRGDLDNAPPLLGAELVRAALAGARFPERVLAEALNRCAAEQGPTRARAALIKAFLIRNRAVEVTVALDPKETNPAYRLGRLFAVLEGLQQAAVGPNATIRDRYWGAASSTPAFVFPQLLSLATSHLGKLESDKTGLARWYERQIGEIASALPPSLPATLSIVDRGRFAIGYWHQRYASKADASSKPSDDTTTTGETDE